jgi:hypothetical protein
MVTNIFLANLKKLLLSNLEADHEIAFSNMEGREREILEKLSSPGYLTERERSLLRTHRKKPTGLKLRRAILKLKL